ncbi:hypothetical protein AWC38_SpisGene11162 [Stylophora pistillata]|uniref:Uncharacterized protein n=1 Tax=Stylophora pistillata TaxID=50429 RepID=A0A2B4S737_STYPI|nr:hypothetical protein AWC38_SpisGene11162 [Stylophora pistillata]
MADCGSIHHGQNQRKEKIQRKEMVGNEDESKDAITERLWNIASSRLNVKQHHGESQEIKKTNPCEEPSGPWFDDLAGEILIYEELYSKENYFTRSKADNTEPYTWDKDDDSSFEMLADVQWDL